MVLTASVHRSIAAALALVLLAGCTSMMLGGGQSSGRPIGSDSRTQTAQASDLRITAIVRNRINYDDELGGQDIRIDTLRGVVTLRGSVESYTQRDRAGRLAMDVPDVERVVNQLAIVR